MAANEEEKRNLNCVRKKILKLEQMKKDIKCETRELALKRNALLEISQSTCCSTRYSRPSEAIRKTSFAIKRIIATAQHPLSAIEKLQLAIARTEETHLVTGAHSECDVTLSVDGLFILFNGYEFKLPINTLGGRFNLTSPCKGCGQLFPCRERVQNSRLPAIFHVSYFLHIFTCSKFMSMDSVKYCHACKLVFLSLTRLGVHRNKHHPRTSKPAWMTSQTYNQFPEGEMTQQISCPGCKRMFMAKRMAKRMVRYIHPELAYYIHCIEQCPEYKKLNLIAKCEECNKLFLNKRAHGAHYALTHGGNVSGEAVRSWMSQNLKRHKRYNLTYNSSVECEGCHKKFPSSNRSGGTHRIHRSYYIHCIEECKPYRALGKIFTCPKCRCKYVRKQLHQNCS